ncbi:MAG: tRNA threonylcarbamoyladenosine dehydratase [Verrucomicrobia bacterium]|nr:tRNA threonylcarbamoyladenosine dehydratase [Verrucomicrobiota bacterium]
MGKGIQREVRFNRFYRMIGKMGLERLEKARVTVVGIGAVGSFAVEALARSGVGELHLVDFDFVEASNINRQLIALESTLGREKVEVARERVLDINPECRMETLILKVETASDTEPIFEREPEVILDAIDILDGKATLITEALKRGVTLYSSMGAARRQDPTHVRAGRLGEVTGCPMARNLRRRFKELGIEEKVYNSLECVYSREKAHPSLAEQSENPGVEHGMGDTGAKAPLPSSIAVTGVFGLCLGNLAIQKILQS